MGLPIKYVDRLVFGDFRDELQVGDLIYDTHDWYLIISLIGQGEAFVFGKSGAKKSSLSLVATPIESPEIVFRDGVQIWPKE